MKLLSYVAGTLLCALPLSANAATIVADTVIEYFESSAGIGGTGTNPNGGGGGIRQNSEVPLSHAIDGDATTFISLPTQSFITLGFSTGFIFDGAGADLFVSEVGAASEFADVFVSEDFGATFTFLAQANGGTTTGIDFADFNYTGNVNAVRVVGLDSRGTAPGFDIALVRGLEDSVVIDPQMPVNPVPQPPVNPVPLPAGMPMLIGAMLAFGAVRRMKK